MTTKKYAKGTTVAVEKSIAEIKDLLSEHGATNVQRLEKDNLFAIAFELEAHDYPTPLLVRIRVTLPIPDPRDDQFWVVRTNAYSTGRRTPIQAEKVYQDEVKRLYRALFLSLKADLEAVNISKIKTVIQAFGMSVVMADGTTLTEWAVPQIRQMYASGKMPPLLPPSAID
jgi:hypothetical protein